MRETWSLVDDLRRDETWSTGRPHLRFHRMAENTVIAKENAGLGLATGEIVCFMDDDAAARANWLERIVAWYADPSVGAVGGRDLVRLDDRVLDEPARDVGRVRWFRRLIGNHHKHSVGARDVDFLKGVNMSFRRALLPRIDERLDGPVPYGFEIDLGLHVRGLGYRLVYDPEIVVDDYPSTHYGAASPIAWTSNRNQTYVLLKRLPLPGSAARWASARGSEMGARPQGPRARLHLGPYGRRRGRGLQAGPGLCRVHEVNAHQCGRRRRCCAVRTAHGRFRRADSGHSSGGLDAAAGTSLTDCQARTVQRRWFGAARSSPRLRHAPWAAGHQWPPPQPGCLAMLSDAACGDSGYEVLRRSGPSRLRWSERRNIILG